MKCKKCGYPLLQKEYQKELGFYETGPLCGDCEWED